MMSINNEHFFKQVSARLSRPSMRATSSRPLAVTVSTVYSCAPCSSQGTWRGTTMSPTRSPCETTRLLPRHLGVGSRTVGLELWTEIQGNTGLITHQRNEAGLVHLWHLQNIWRYQWSGYSACQTMARLVLGCLCHCDSVIGCRGAVVRALGPQSEGTWDRTGCWRIKPWTSVLFQFTDRCEWLPGYRQ